jgi:dihydrofolate synthase/folylpolyglutamate synthase
MQRVERDRDWLFDVAHNPAAAGVLAATLGSGGEARRTVAIIGMRDDKDVEGIVAPLADVVDAWIAVAIDDSHATAVDELARRVANATGKGCLEAPSIARAIAAARERTSPGERVLVTGSFYLVGPALAALDL